jgi:DNA-binding transcriptional ArsR family regulator
MQEMAEALKVLADPARLQILQELARAEPAGWGSRSPTSRIT